ncbi:MAG: radical SAM protein [[Clostridium] scindens]
MVGISFDKKCVEYSEAKTKDKEIYFYITTNGTLLTEQIISYLCEHNFNITISLDGDKEEHNKNRRFLEGTGSFDLIMNNLQKIKDYDEIFFNKVRYNAVVSPKSDWNKVFKFFSESSLIDPHNVKLNPVADDCLVNKSLIEADENFWIPYRYEYMKLLLYMIGELKFNDIHPSFEKSMFEIKRLYKMLQQHNCEQPKMHHSGPCLPGIQRLFVDTVGRFYPCGKGKRKYTRYEHRFSRKRI